MEDDYIHLSTTDTGVGISEEVMENIFEPLFTTKTKGIGLGLVVASTGWRKSMCKNQATKGRPL